MLASPSTYTPWLINALFPELLNVAPGHWILPSKFAFDSGAVRIKRRIALLDPDFAFAGLSQHHRTEPPIPKDDHVHIALERQEHIIR
jgi:hypothetical protein